MGYIKSFKNIQIDSNQTINCLGEGYNTFAHRFLILVVVVIFTVFYINYSVASNINNSININNDVLKDLINEEDLADSKSNISNNKISTTDILIGNKNAKVIFIEYFAPTCTHCSEYHAKVFPALKRKYIDRGKIAYVMRECVGNKQDFDASLLSRCKGNVDSYQTLTNHLLHTQDDWAYSKDYRSNLYKIANNHGISDKQYDLCLNDDIKANTLFDHAKLVINDTDFIGTPSFYINGKLFKAEYSQGGLSNAIDDELTKQEGN